MIIVKSNNKRMNTKNQCCAACEAIYHSPSGKEHKWCKKSDCKCHSHSAPSAPTAQVEDTPEGVEGVVEEFCQKFVQKTDWVGGDWDVLTADNPEPIIDWLRATLTTERQRGAEEARADVIAEMREGLPEEDVIAYGYASGTSEKIAHNRCRQSVLTLLDTLENKES